MRSLKKYEVAYFDYEVGTEGVGLPKTVTKIMTFFVL